MKYLKHTIFFALIACVDPIQLDFNTKSILVPVVDAEITRGGSVVYLSWAHKFSNEPNKPIEGAKVFLISEVSDTTFFRSNAPGRYRPNSLFLQFNTRYKLSIILPDDRTIESDYQTYLIDQNEPIELKYRIITKTYVRPYDDKIINSEGFELFINIDPIENNVKKYFRYQIEPIWKLEAPGATINRFKNCYIRDYDIVLLNIAEQKNDSYAHTVGFMPIDWKMDHGIAFNLTAKQINKSTFEYYKQIETQIDYTGSPFETPPVSAKSNLHFINEGESEVLGFFRINTVNSYYFFIGKDKIPDHFTFQELCELTSLIRYCSNCTEWNERNHGISNNKPWYWGK